MLGQGITSPSEPYFKNGLWAWNGSAWVKLSPPWGASDSIVEDVPLATAAAGTNVLNGTTCPAGEVWVVEFAAGINNTTNPAGIYIESVIKGVNVPLAFTAAPGIGIWVRMDTRTTLFPGDYVRAVLAGCVLNDNIDFRYCGYKMEVG